MASNFYIKQQQEHAETLEELMAAGQIVAWNFSQNSFDQSWQLEVTYQGYGMPTKQQPKPKEVEHLEELKKANQVMAENIKAKDRLDELNNKDITDLTYGDIIELKEIASTALAMGAFNAGALLGLEIQNKKLQEKLEEDANNTAADLAEELADDMEFAKEFIELCPAIRQLRAKSAYEWVHFWAWMKDGVYYVGSGVTTLKEARRLIAKKYGVNVDSLEGAADIL